MAKITPNAQHASAKPTAAGKTDKPKKENKRADFVATVDKKNEAVYPFSSTPDGFDFTKNRPLKKKDFTKPSAFMDYAADALEAKAKLFRAKAEDMRKTGDGKGGGKANRLLKMMEKAQKLREELRAQGIDVDALLSATKPAEKPAEETAAAAA